MADKNNENLKSITKKIEELKTDIPNIILPTMGIIEEENKININNQDYLNKKEVKED